MNQKINKRIYRKGDFVHRLSYETISHYINVAEYSLSCEINEKQCYGMPCLLLLCSSIDAIGSYYQGKNYPKFKKSGLISTTNAKDRFYTFFHLKGITEKYGVLAEDLVCLFYEGFRCLCTHNASLSENVGIIKDNSNGSLVKKNEEQVIINLPILLDQVKIGFNMLEVELKKIDKGIKNLKHPESMPLTGVTASLCSIEKEQ